MPNIQEMLMDIIKDCHGNQSRAARRIGISKSYLSELLAGKTGASAGTEELISKVYREGSMDLPVVRQANDRLTPIEPPLRKIPVVSWTSAGAMASYEDLANQIDELVDSTTKDPNAFAIEVNGESMEREVHSGDYVVLEPNREASSGDMAYVRLSDEAGGGGTLKWFYRSGPQGRVIKLVAENPDWPTTEHPVETIKFAYPVHNIIRRRPKRRT